MSAYKCILHALISFSCCLNEDIEYLSTEDAFALFSSSNGSLYQERKPVSLTFIYMNVSVFIKTYYIFRQFFFCQVCPLPRPPRQFYGPGYARPSHSHSSTLPLVAVVLCDKCLVLSHLPELHKGCERGPHPTSLEEFNFNFTDVQLAFRRAKYG